MPMPAIERNPAGRQRPSTVGSPERPALPCAHSVVDGEHDGPHARTAHVRPAAHALLGGGHLHNLLSDGVVALIARRRGP